MKFPRPEEGAIQKPRNHSCLPGFQYAVNLFRKGKARILLAVIGLIVAGAIFFLWPRKDALARWKADMRARGEKLTLVELAPPFRAESSGGSGSGELGQGVLDTDARRDHARVGHHCRRPQALPA